MTQTLTEQIEEYFQGWLKRVPPDRQAVMERHIAQLKESGFVAAAKKAGDKAPSIVLADQNGETVDVGTFLARGPVIVTFYRGGWCPYCNFELKAYQDQLARIRAAGAELVAISPEKPDDTLSTAQKNELTYPVLTDVGQSVGRAFGVVYSFTEELKWAYGGFGLDIPAKNGSEEWALPMSATYVIGTDGVIMFADPGSDYRRRTDPLDVLALLERRAAAE